MKKPPLIERLKIWWTAKDRQGKFAFLNKAVIWCTVVNLCTLVWSLIQIFYFPGACK